MSVCISEVATIGRCQLRKVLCCKNRIVVLTMDGLLEMCIVGVLLNKHTICYSHNNILLGISLLHVAVTRRMLVM